MAFTEVAGPAGRLEAVLWKVEAAKAAVVVCHPHPLHGGTMHNHVTYRIAQAFREAQVTSLRFNFRGVGLSAGTHDEGRGEVEDARAALTTLSDLEPNVPLIVAGFSFGARVALKLAHEDSRCTKVLAVGVPVNLEDLSFAKAVRAPKAFVHGDRDEFGTVSQIEQLVAELPGPKRLFIVTDCDHLAVNRLDELLRVAKSAVTWLLE